MNNLTPWEQSITASVQQAWAEILAFVPRFIGAIIIFLIGWLVATIVFNIARKVFHWMKIDTALSRSTDYTTRAGTHLTPSYLLAKVLYWFLIVIFLIAAADTLGLAALSTFLQQIAGYIPKVFAAAIFLFIAFELAGFVRTVIEGSLEKGGQASRISASIAWWGIVIFGVFAALVELELAVSIINIITGGVVLMLAIAGGLAFGLGGRESAGRLVQRWEDRMIRK